jgi:hypothetical protein
MAHMHTIKPRNVHTGPVINLNGGGRNPHSSGIKSAPAIEGDCSFADVRRACTLWLIKNDPSYRVQHDAAMEQVARRKARKAGQSVPDDGNQDTIRRNNFSSRI